MHDNLNSTSLDDHLSVAPEVTAEHAEHPTTKDQVRTASATIKTWVPSKQPEVPAKIRTVSPVLAKAQNAKKGFAAPVGKRTQATYPLQKPPKSKFVRVHPSPEYHLAGVRTLTDRDTGEIKYVD
ncbi:MAG: hypothetical protein JWO20_3123, partial [Candidatus Angelobacter sp.]|nr:hypothetical protein [Candidatus Angelobacter sp.]